MICNAAENPVYGENLSIAWARAFDKCWNAPGGVLYPGIVNFDVSSDKPDGIETLGIRDLLEEFLQSSSPSSIIQSPINTVANTIFPASIWKICHGDRRLFYEMYSEMWPRIKKCKANHRGIYFRRLIAFNDDMNKGNQLERIIAAWKKDIHRLSALQAGIFDPLRDHIAARQLGFPCLQQVVFRPIGANGKDGLSVVAFYANQLLLEKGYGNYLGLYRLGKFMASQMGLELKKVVCIATALKRGKASKAKCRPLIQKLKEICPDGQ